jgi:hypothetical protein
LERFKELLMILKLLVPSLNGYKYNPSNGEMIGPVAIRVECPKLRFFEK